MTGTRRQVERPARLSDSFVRNIQHPGRCGDGRGGNGLSLMVRPRKDGTITKSWTQRITIDHKVTMLGLGSFSTVSLEEARRLALENARAAAEGRDPRLDYDLTFNAPPLGVSSLGFAGRSSGLTVSWTPTDNSGRAAISSYELR